MNEHVNLENIFKIFYMNNIIVNVNVMISCMATKPGIYKIFIKVQSKNSKKILKITLFNIYMTIE